MHTLKPFSYYLATVAIAAISDINAQIDPRTNAIFETAGPQVEHPMNTQRQTEGAGWNCLANNFYVIDNYGQIIELVLNGNTVSVTNTLQVLGELSLAFSNNLNGTYSPTFYSQNNSGSVFNGSTFQAVGLSGYLNYGGGGNHLYLHNSSAGTVSHYNGTQINTIYVNSQKSLGVADLAVDQQGNVIFVTGSNTTSDSLFVMTPSGQIVHQFPLSVPYYHAYGSMYLNGIYYIGYGGNNSTYPHKLLPLTITATSVSVGSPISMPAGNFYDLANCAGSDITGIAEEAAGSFSFFPNPATREIECESLLAGEQKIDLFGLDGKLHLHTTRAEQHFQLALPDVPAGIYILVVQGKNSKGAIHKKLVIQ